MSKRRNPKLEKRAASKARRSLLRAIDHALLSLEPPPASFHTMDLPYARTFCSDKIAGHMARIFVLFCLGVVLLGMLAEVAGC